MLDRGAEQLLGLGMEDLIHPDDLAENRALLARLLRTGAPFTLEKRYRKPDLSWVWISSSVSRLDDEHGRPQALIAVKTDITERHRIELAWRELNETLEQRVGREVAERDKAEEALRQSQKMEAVGQLTGGVAHDFNNVLQIISGNLQLLHQDAAAGGQARRRLDTAIAAVERGAKLSSQLLAFARRQPLQPVALDLGRLLGDMDELLRRAMGETVDIVVQVGAGLWNTLVDPGQLESVILNLAINARDAMRGEGRLTVALGNAVLDEIDVNQLTDVAAGQYVQLTVSDTGCGMSEEVLQRAFEPFFTTKPQGEGTGLGLSMAYGFVKQSRGHIKIVSAPGAGATVRIYLPRSMRPRKRPWPSRRTWSPAAARRCWWSRTTPTCAPPWSTCSARSATGCWRPRPATRRCACCGPAPRSTCCSPTWSCRGRCAVPTWRAARASCCPTSPCCSPQAIRKTPSSTAAGSTPASSCSASPTGARNWRASSATCWPTAASRCRRACAWSTSGNRRRRPRRAPRCASWWSRTISIRSRWCASWSACSATRSAAWPMARRRGA